MRAEQIKKILKLEEGTKPKILEQKTGKIDKNSGNFVGLVQSSEIGFLIALPISLGALFGWWLDSKFDSQPKLMLSLLFLGVFIGFTNLFVIIKLYSKKNKK